MNYYSLDFDAACQVWNAIWAAEDATGQARTCFHQFFRGRAGHIWVTDPAKEAALVALLDRDGVPYTATAVRPDSDPWVDWIFTPEEKGARGG